MSNSNPYADTDARVSQPLSEEDYTVVLVDDPAPHVRRITLNRPEKRNALNDALRGALFDALRAADRSRDVSVIIIRGAGSCWSSR